MEPGPLTASPPSTDQKTGAAPPPVSVAASCNDATLAAPAALQPVQLVSMAAVPGVTEKAAFEGLAATVPPHPAKASSAGPRSSEKILHLARIVNIFVFNLLYRLHVTKK
jgi:hypothetical protein